MTTESKGFTAVRKAASAWGASIGTAAVSERAALCAIVTAAIDGDDIEQLISIARDAAHKALAQGKGMTKGEAATQVNSKIDAPLSAARRVYQRRDRLTSAMLGKIRKGNASILSIVVTMNKADKAARDAKATEAKATEAKATEAKATEAKVTAPTAPTVADMAKALVAAIDATPDLSSDDLAELATLWNVLTGLAREESRKAA